MDDSAQVSSESKLSSLVSIEESSAKNSICPSKTTVYLGNISYHLTNNDLIQLLEHCGKVVCAKIAKDRITRKSKGYAFVQFLKTDDAHKCVQEYNGVEMFGRKWSCSIAKDNGRSSEFITKRFYPDKSRCYECGDFGHLSYKCSKNSLGNREPPPSRKKKRKRSSKLEREMDNNDDDSTSEEDKGEEEEEIDSLSAAISYQRTNEELQEYRNKVAKGDYSMPDSEGHPKRPKFVKDGYFSDEECLEDDH